MWGWGSWWGMYRRASGGSRRDSPISPHRSTVSEKAASFLNQIVSTPGTGFDVEPDVVRKGIGEEGGFSVSIGGPSTAL